MQRHIRRIVTRDIQDSQCSVDKAVAVKPGKMKSLLPLRAAVPEIDLSLDCPYWLL
jgi:hypothetical protein